MSKKAEKGAATRQSIVDGAARLFATHGFAATSIEAVLSQCGISRGALYHHFTNKEELFEAAFEALESRIVQRLSAHARAGDDPVGALRAGCAAWLDLAQDAEIRQMAFIDAPSVLGWQKWREIESRYGFGLLKAGITAANANEGVAKPFIDTYAHILLAALNEVGMMIARSPDPREAAKIGKAAVNDLLNKILSSG